MSRKPLIAGNWKMNLNHFEANALVQKIAFSLPDKYSPRSTSLSRRSPTCAACRPQSTPTSRCSPTAPRICPRTTRVPTPVTSAGRSWPSSLHLRGRRTLERRTYHHEDDATVAAKAAAAFRHGLIPIVCIGEHLEVREAGNHSQHRPVARLAGRTDRGAVGHRGHRLRAGLGDRHRPVASAADAQEVRRDPCRAGRHRLGEAWPTACGCSMAARSTPRTSARSSASRMWTAPWSAVRVAGGRAVRHPVGHRRWWTPS